MENIELRLVAAMTKYSNNYLKKIGIECDAEQITYEEAIRELEWIYQNGFENDLSIVGVDRILDSIRIAIESLEKQIPKKPNKYVDTTRGMKKKVNVCPKCDYYLGNYVFMNTLEKNKMIYCKICGQAINLSEVE